jgi:hypothetical protein
MRFLVAVPEEAPPPTAALKVSNRLKFALKRFSENSDRTLATSHEGKAATRSGHIRRIHAEVQTHCRQSVSS